MAPEQKRRKIEPPRRTVSSGAKKTSNATSMSGSNSTVRATQTGGVDFRIQQAKNFAVAEAQQEGCTGNFRIFDSPFGNFLVPVVPSRSELAE